MTRNKNLTLTLRDRSFWRGVCFSGLATESLKIASAASEVTPPLLSLRCVSLFYYIEIPSLIYGIPTIKFVLVLCVIFHLIYN